MTAAGVKECPERAIRTVSPLAAAWRTTPATSATDRGVSTCRGLADWLPAQLRQLPWAMPGRYRSRRPPSRQAARATVPQPRANR